MRSEARSFLSMPRRLVTSLVLVLTLTSVGKAETIHTLILKGRLDEARDSLSQQASAATRDGNMLFYQSLLETDGEQAVRLMEAALKTSLQSRSREEIAYRLAQYHLLRKDYRELSRLLAEYRSTWESGRYRAAMLRLSVLVDEHDRQYESALRQCDRYLVDSASEDARQWGLIDKARIMKEHGKRIGANETLRQLSRARKGIGVSPALYLLCDDAINRKRADDAIFFYNILREGFPAAVGLDALMNGLGDMTARSDSDTRAEELTGTFYCVKVGVFSESDNARRQADKFRGYDQKVEIQTKDISGKKYRVVYVGSFQDYDEAVRFKLRLEAAHQEAFQVVAR